MTEAKTGGLWSKRERERKKPWLASGEDGQLMGGKESLGLMGAKKMAPGEGPPVSAGGLGWVVQSTGVRPTSNQGCNSHQLAAKSNYPVSATKKGDGQLTRHLKVQSPLRAGFGPKKLAHFTWDLAHLPDNPILNRPPRIISDNRNPCAQLSDPNDPGGSLRKAGRSTDQGDQRGCGLGRPTPSIHRSLS